MGAKKIFEELKDDFKRCGFKIGRDKFIAILKKNGLLVKRKKKTPGTTNSKHRFYKYANF